MKKSEEKIAILKEDEDAKLTRILVFLTILSFMGAFLFGYDTGIISGAMLPIVKHFELSTFYQELVVTLCIITAAVFSLLAGTIAEALGRRPTILVSSVMFAAGSLVLAFSPNKYALLAGRAICGVGIGQSSMIVPIYVAETSPKQWRGRILNLYQFFIVAGMLAANLISALFYADQQNGWRYSFGLGAVPALLQLLGMLFMPETPRYLIIRGRIEDAKLALMRIRGVSAHPATQVAPERLAALDTEFAEIQQSYVDSVNALNSHLQNTKTAANQTTPPSKQQQAEDEEEEREQQQQRSAPSNNACCPMSGGAFSYQWTIVCHMMYDHSARRALVIACGLLMWQQLSAINTIMYYMAIIVRQSGITSVQTVLWITVAISALFAGFSLCSNVLTERLGRRGQMLLSGVCALVSLSLIAIGFQITASVEDFRPRVDVVERLLSGGGAAGGGKIARRMSECALKASCRTCIQSSHCGFCYMPDRNNFAVNSSCLAALNHYSDYSMAGRCSRLHKDSTIHSLVWSYDVCPTKHAWIVLIGIVLYLGSFALGIGPVPWTINSEIFPLWCRSAGAAMATATNWSCNILVSMTFLSLSSAIHVYGVYWCYAGLMLLMLAFIYWLLPETKGKTLEEVTTLLKKGYIVTS